jgi:hypothetical protein
MRRLTVPLRVGLRTWLATILILVAAAGVRADDANLIIQIAPPGSVLELTGPQSAVSASPNVIPRPVPGWYRLRASHPGYESWSTELYIDAATPERIAAGLSPKTRFKAGLRALAFPGWGHYYAGRTGRGVFMTVVALGAAGGYLYLDNRADSKIGDFESLQRQFAAASSTAEQERLQPQLDAARRDAFNAESDKRNWGWGTVAFYAYQVLDAVLFFPKPPQVALSGVQFGVVTPAPGRVSLGAAYAF